MASRRKNSAQRSPGDTDRVRRKRLRLIKKRHQELIVRPRDGFLDAFAEEAGFEEFEETEELQILEGYGVGQGL